MRPPPGRPSARRLWRATAALLLNAKSGLNQSQAASALSHGRVLTPDLNHGRLDAYQAISAWKSSGSGWSW